MFNKINTIRTLPSPGEVSFSNVCLLLGNRARSYVLNAEHINHRSRFIINVMKSERAM